MVQGVVICGDGPLIPSVCMYLLKSHRRVNLISPNPSLAIEGVDFTEGDPTDSGELSRAGVGDASDIIVICAEDWDAAVIVMNARKINEEATIVVNVNRENSAQKLYSLGASRVVFPLSVSGHLIASAASSPVLAEFMDRIILTQDIEIGHIEIDEDSDMVGKKIGDLKLREMTGCWVLGIVSPGKEFVPNPGSEAEIQDGQTLICLGSSEGLRDFFESAKSSYREGGG